MLFYDCIIKFKSQLVYWTEINTKRMICVFIKKLKKSGYIFLNGKKQKNKVISSSTDINLFLIKNSIQNAKRK